MSYGFLRDLKKEKTTVYKRVFHKNLVVGNDYACLKLVQNLMEKDNPGDIKLLNKNILNEEGLFFKGPSYIRDTGENTFEQLTQMFPQLNFAMSEQASSFYKDQKFRPFGGRSKSLPLKKDEEFFTQKKIEFDQKQLLNDDLIELINQQKEFFLHEEIKSIEKVDQRDDLVEQVYWRVACTNGHVYECESLFWGESPYLFFKLFSNKNSLSKEFVSLCESIQAPYSLCIEFTAKGRVCDKTQTLFIPQSLTHEWGHFIGEFSPYDKERQQQEFLFFTFVDEKHTSDEEISKKIRILKNSLKRIFPDFGLNPIEEKITLSSKTPCLNFDKINTYSSLAEMEKLSFVGVNAPLGNIGDPKESQGDSKGFVYSTIRALSSLQQLELRPC